MGGGAGCAWLLWVSEWIRDGVYVYMSTYVLHVFRCH